MKILLTNDDGIFAPGIQVLAALLQEKGHHIALVAPDRQRSASGHAITLHSPLRARRTEQSGLQNADCFRVSGTPVDCVKLGVTTLLDFEPDLIISGINDNANIGFDVLYSGTVSAAIEGWLMNYTSLAISLFRKDKEVDREFQKAAEFVCNFLKNGLKKYRKGEKCLLNINIPADVNPDLAEIKITSLTECLYDDYYETRVDPLGEKYYWLTGEVKGQVRENTDLAALQNNKISITPLDIKLTDKKLFKKYNQR